MPELVAGLIVIWQGLLIDIPDGWVLCDGNNGTPNLTDRFVQGAGDTHAPDDTGGALVHTHGFTGDGHSHTHPLTGGIQAGAPFGITTSIDPATGTTDNGSSLPPWYALAYIMKT